MGQDAPHLDGATVRHWLDRLVPMADDVVLIGGQALNLWAERYSRVPEIESAAPFTSKDIDFGGEASHVERCAVLLGGSARVYGPKDRSFCAGVVTSPDGVELDFVRVPMGVPLKEIQRRAISLGPLRVMIRHTCSSAAPRT